MGWTGHLMEKKMSKTSIKKFVKDELEKGGYNVLSLIVKGDNHYSLVETINGETFAVNTIAYCAKRPNPDSPYKWELMVKDVNPFGDNQAPISLVRGLMKANGSTPELEFWMTVIKNK